MISSGSACTSNNIEASYVLSGMGLSKEVVNSSIRIGIGRYTTKKDINNAIRDIFSVASRENDQVSIVFGDGNFGNVPKGIIRVWYRTGLNQTYTLTPDSFNSSSFNLSYIGQNGNTFNAIFNVSLKTNVTNASVRESLRSIKSNAPRFFATQDRMVTAEDYSIFPVTVSENMVGHKFGEFSPTRTYKGHTADKKTGK